MIVPNAPARQEVINRMNAGRKERNEPLLTPRQEHIICEFVDIDGQLDEAERPFLAELLRSNSA
jgi:hypothetical protein